MADASIPIDDRIKQSDKIYKLANSIAHEINYDKEKYIDFLWNYSDFLSDYARYDKALDVYNRLIKLCEDYYGKEHLDTASSYNGIGNVYFYLKNSDKALEYYRKAMEIKEKILGKEHRKTAEIYSNIGITYDCKNKKALEYLLKSLSIFEKVLGKEHPNTAKTYSDIGTLYSNLCDYDKALMYHKLAINIYEKNPNPIFKEG